MTMVLIAGLAAPSATQQRSTNLSPEERALRLQEELRAPRPLEALNSVWIEERTWMEVRDALAAGKTTAIIPTVKKLMQFRVDQTVKAINAALSGSAPTRQ